MSTPKFFILIFPLLLIICIIGCRNEEDNRLESALNKAEKNRIELQNVLDYYNTELKDSLKYKAACFLIENMPYHSFYDGDQLNKYYKYFECIKGRKNEINNIIDSLISIDGRFNISTLKIKNDIKNIDSEYLIQNVDWAFKVWKEQPWGKNVSFEQFCEYILPYRLGDESPVCWREELYELYNPMLDSIRNRPEAEDPLFVARVLLDSLVKEPVTFTGLLPGGPHLGPNVVRWRSGTCRELADIVTYILRSVGIPCSMDFMTRGDNNADHYWNVVISKDKKEYMIEFPATLFRPVEDYHNPKGKVYRRTFSINRKSLSDMDTYSFFIHPTFRNPLFIDVTSHYTSQKPQNLTLPRNILYEGNSTKDIVYLCVSRRRDWLPIAWTLLDKDSLCFSNVEGNIVFRLATWNGFKLKLSSDPFLFEKETGNVRYFNSTMQMDTVCIYFKYHLYNETYIYRMPGGVFEGSNDKYFRNRDTLFLIDQVPERLYNTIHIKPTHKKYRYIRYKGGENSHCNIAEIEFFESENTSIPLTGKIIGTPGCWQGDGSHEYMHAFDGDPYTSFDYTDPSSGWTGLDLEKPHCITKIRYAPRNRDNFIRKGDNYELFYWKNKKWNSAGKQEAKADSLIYVVPEKSLLYLKNHTRGKDERILEYRNGKQRFW